MAPIQVLIPRWLGTRAGQRWTRIPAGMPPASEDRSRPSAESLFGAWLARREAGEAQDFAALCRAHAERAAGLAKPSLGATKVIRMCSWPSFSTSRP